MKKKTLLQLLKDKAKILLDVDDLFIESLKSTEKALFSAMLIVLRKLDVKNGVIQNNKKNNDLLLSIKSSIYDTIKKSTYTNKIDGYLTNFDRVERLNKDIYKTTIGQSIARIGLSNQKKIAIEEVTDALVGKSNINNQFVNPIRRTLLNAVAFQKTYQEAEDDLRTFIKGKNGSGELSKYVGRVVRDGINQFDGYVNDRVREEFNLDGFMYVNSLVATSRSNCKNLVNSKGAFKSFAVKEGIYKVEDIPNILRRADKGKGSGFNPSVTPSNFAQYRMGYNCRHSVIYINLEDIEDYQQIENDEID